MADYVSKIFWRLIGAFSDAAMPDISGEQPAESSDDKPSILLVALACTLDVPGQVPAGMLQIACVPLDLLHGCPDQALTTTLDTRA